MHRQLLITFELFVRVVNNINYDIKLISTKYRSILVHEITLLHYQILIYYQIIFLCYQITLLHYQILVYYEIILLSYQIT